MRGFDNHLLKTIIPQGDSFYFLLPQFAFRGSVSESLEPTLSKYSIDCKKPECKLQSRYSLSKVHCSRKTTAVNQFELRMHFGSQKVDEYSELPCVSFQNNELVIKLCKEVEIQQHEHTQRVTWKKR